MNMAASRKNLGAIHFDCIITKIVIFENSQELTHRQSAFELALCFMMQLLRFRILRLRVSACEWSFFENSHFASLQRRARWRTALECTPASLKSVVHVVVVCASCLFVIFSHWSRVLFLRPPVHAG